MGLIARLKRERRRLREQGLVNNADPWAYNRPLFPLSEKDHFYLENAYAHTGVFGEIGSSKSTGSVARFITEFMAAGFGGLICCVKPGERETMVEYARLTGRADSLIIVSPGNHWRCNLLQYALKRPGIIGSRVEAGTAFIWTILECMERGEGSQGSKDAFWSRGTRQMIRNALEVGIAAGVNVTMTTVNEVIMSMPRTPEEVHDPKWQKNSLCYQMIENADAREKTPREQADFELAARYFLREIPEMPHDTRGSLLATYSGLADILLRGQMADLFNGKTNFVPELTYEGAIIILDLPTKTYGQAGVYVQVGFSHLYQSAVEQLDVKVHPRPLMFVADEFQELISPKTSAKFFATARSVRCAGLLCSQNLPNYIAALGGGDAGRHEVDAFVAAMGTKIFHANGDIATNKFASETINDAVQTRWNFSSRSGGDGGGGGGEQIGRKVLPAKFTTLKKGGPKHLFVTEAIVYQTGASFIANDGEPWLETSFRQIIPGVTV